MSFTLQWLSNCQISCRALREMDPSNQFFGSGSAGIRIDLALQDPDRYWESGSVLGIRIWIHEQEIEQKLTNKHDFQPFKMAFVPKYRMFYDILPTLSTYTFHTKIQLFVTAKSDED
jgi:hypothetical protein